MSTFTWIIPEPAPTTPPPTGSGVVTPAGQLFGNFDQEIDPDTRDYIDTADGAWAETESSRSAVMLQLEIRYGEWWVDPEAGSRIPAMLESGEPVTPEQIADEARRALQMLVVDGVIADLAVSIGETDDDAGVMELQIVYTDMSSGHPVQLSYSPL
ncbi:MAG: hypothetical protein AB7O24_01175 [Kofleriaceae bacterium]